MYRYPYDFKNEIFPHYKGLLYSSALSRSYRYGFLNNYCPPGGIPSSFTYVDGFDAPALPSLLTTRSQFRTTLRICDKNKVISFDTCIATRTRRHTYLRGNVVGHLRNISEFGSVVQHKAQSVVPGREKTRKGVSSVQS